MRAVSRRRPQVLVVDDEPPIREILCDYLDLLECDAAAAASADEARVLLDQASFDLVLTDIVMPGTDGLQFAEAAQRRQPAVPVVIVSGVAAATAALRRIRERGWAFVPKPVAFDAFQVVVERALGLGPEP